MMALDHECGPVAGGAIGDCVTEVTHGDQLGQIAPPFGGPGPDDTPASSERAAYLKLGSRIRNPRLNFERARSRRNGWEVASYYYGWEVPGSPGGCPDPEPGAPTRNPGPRTG